MSSRESALRVRALAHALTMRPLTGARGEMAALQAVLEAAPDYFLRVTGGPPRAEAQNLFTALPQGKTYDDKHVWGLYLGEVMIGCADVIRGYPRGDTAVIGLLLLAERWQGRGLGRAFAALVLRAIAQWSEIATLRIGVAETNPRALAFWRALGFRETGEVKPAARGVVAAVRVLEKPSASAERA